MNNSEQSVKRLQQVVTLGALSLALVHLIWPDLAIDSITLALIIIAIIPWLAPIFKSIELPGGWKIQFQDLQKAAAKAETLGLLAPELPKMVEAELPFRTAEERDPNLALAGLRIEIEKRLTKLAQAHQLEPRRQGVGQLLRLLSQHDVLNGEERSVLADLIGLLNGAVHGAQVDQRAAEWAMEVGPRLLNGLDDRIAGGRISAK